MRKSRIEAKVLNFLLFKEEPWAPKAIATALKENYNSVKSACKRLADRGEIVRHERGLYRSKELIITPSKALYAPLQLHGLKLEYKKPKCTEGEGRPFLCTRAGNYTTHRHKVNNSITWTEEWEGRVITITESKVHVEVWLRAGDSPLDYHSFRAFRSWLNGYFNTILTGQWIITMLGINWDIQRLRLEGISKISLQTFENLWFNMYQKRQDTVRIEAHMTTKIDFATALQLFTDYATQITNTLKLMNTTKK